MTTPTESIPLFDVVIYEKATREIDAVIGTAMKRHTGFGKGRNTAELRAQTGRERINEYFAVKIVDAGKYKKGDILPA